MSFSVEWNEEARNALATAWLSASDRKAVTSAQAMIDRLLEANPAGNGVLLSEGLYVIVVPPLRVLFEMSESEQQVDVVALKVTSS